MSKKTAHHSTVTFPLALFLFMALLIAYAPSFKASFILDDDRLLGELATHHVSQIGNVLALSRPVAYLSLTLNYLIGGLDVWGYHAVNFAIHFFAGLTLFGLVRRTLLTNQLRNHFKSSATWLAFSIALLWSLHPLQTQSVTYIIQRAESLMGLFYLFTIYCVVRGTESKNKKIWSGLAILACALGMGTKQVMATAPLVVVLYDRIFLGNSFQEIFQKRIKLHLGIASTWLILVYYLLTNPIDPSADFNQTGITPIRYILSQTAVILHYLKLSVWPYPLCFDYLWPAIDRFQEIVGSFAAISLSLFLTVVALRFWPCVGFLGVWFFIILAPSSSVIPVADLAVEHRMYLSLAAVISLFVFGVYELLRNLKPALLNKPIFIVLLILLPSTVFAGLTYQRNTVYESRIKIWEDTVQKRPNNYRAHSNLGVLLIEAGRQEEAMRHLKEAIKIKPDYSDAHSNLANLYAEQKQTDDAFYHYEEALKYDARNASAHNNLANMLANQKKFDEAIGHYQKAVKITPDNPYLHNNLGIAFGQNGNVEKSILHFEQALRLKPDYAVAQKNLNIQKAKRGA
jgi:protein O-mannosyl-transferase